MCSPLRQHLTHVEVVRRLKEVVQLDNVRVPLRDLLEDLDLVADLSVSLVGEVGSRIELHTMCSRPCRVSAHPALPTSTRTQRTHSEELLVQDLARIVLASLCVSIARSWESTLMWTHSLTTALGGSVTSTRAVETTGCRTH